MHIGFVQGLFVVALLVLAALSAGAAFGVIELRFAAWARRLVAGATAGERSSGPSRTDVDEDEHDVAHAYRLLADARRTLAERSVDMHCEDVGMCRVTLDSATDTVDALAKRLPELRRRIADPGATVNERTAVTDERLHALRTLRNAASDAYWSDEHHGADYGLHLRNLSAAAAYSPTLLANVRRRYAEAGERRMVLWYAVPADVLESLRGLPEEYERTYAALERASADTAASLRCMRSWNAFERSKEMNALHERINALLDLSKVVEAGMLRLVGALGAKDARHPIRVALSDGLRGAAHKPNGSYLDAMARCEFTRHDAPIAVSAAQLAFAALRARYTIAGRESDEEYVFARTALIHAVCAGSDEERFFAAMRCMTAIRIMLRVPSATATAYGDARVHAAEP